MREYEMSQEQFDKIIDACQPVPMIMLQCGSPPSPQERANDAWESLGLEMGFQYMTVKPSPKGGRFFTAEEVLPSTLGQSNGEPYDPRVEDR